MGSNLKRANDPPKDVRKVLRLQPGDKLRCILLDGEARIHPEGPAGPGS